MRKALLAVASVGMALALAGAGCQTIENSQPQATSTVETTTAPTTTADLSVTASSNSPRSFTVTWVTPSTTNQNSEFRVVYGPEANPTLPLPNDFVFKKMGWYQRSKKSYRDATVGNVSPGTYHVRICEFLKGSCVNYSNDVQVEVK